MKKFLIRAVAKSYLNDKYSDKIKVLQHFLRRNRNHRNSEAGTVPGMINQPAVLTDHVFRQRDFVQSMSGIAGCRHFAKFIEEPDPNLVFIWFFSKIFRYIRLFPLFRSDRENPTSAFPYRPDCYTEQHHVIHYCNLSEFCHRISRQYLLFYLKML